MVGKTTASSYLVSPTPTKNTYMWHRPYNQSQAYSHFPPSEQQQHMSWNALSSCRIEWFSDRAQPAPPQLGGKPTKKQVVSSEDIGFYQRHPTKRAWTENQRNWTPIENGDADDESDSTSGLLTLSNGVGEQTMDQDFGLCHRRSPLRFELLKHYSICFITLLQIFAGQYFKFIDFC